MAGVLAPGYSGLPPIQRLSESVWTILGCNPGPFTLAGTNTYIVGAGSRRILIDCSDGNEDYIGALRSFCLEEGIQIGCILITHSHLDHCGGIPGILSCKDVVTKDVKVYQKRSNLDVVMREGCWIMELPTKSAYEAIDFDKDDMEVRFEEVVLSVKFTPGHTEDSVSYCFPKENSIFVGDVVLGTGSTTFRNLRQYMPSLQKLLELNPDRLYCGHGPCIGTIHEAAPADVSTAIITTERAKDRIALYIKHRQDREDQVLRALRENVGEWHRPTDIARKIYLDGLPNSLLEAASATIALHCEKLHYEGLVEFMPGSVTEPSTRDVPASVYHGSFRLSAGACC